MATPNNKNANTNASKDKNASQVKNKHAAMYEITVTTSEGHTVRVLSSKKQDIACSAHFTNHSAWAPSKEVIKRVTTSSQTEGLF